MGMIAKFTSLADNLRVLYGTADKLTIQSMVVLTNSDPAPAFEKTQLVSVTGLKAFHNYTANVTMPKHDGIAVTVHVTIMTTNSGTTTWYAVLQTANGVESAHSQSVTHGYGTGNDTLTIAIPATDANQYTQLMVVSNHGSSMVRSVDAYVDVS